MLLHLWGSNQWHRLHRGHYHIRGFQWWPVARLKQKIKKKLHAQVQLVAAALFLWLQ